MVLRYCNGWGVVDETVYCTIIQYTVLWVRNGKWHQGSYWHVSFVSSAYCFYLYGSSLLARFWNGVSFLWVADFHWTLSLNFSSSWLNQDKITLLSILEHIPQPLFNHHVAVVAVTVVGHHEYVVRPGAVRVMTQKTDLTHHLGLEFSKGSSKPFWHDRVEKWVDDWIKVVKCPYKKQDINIGLW